MNRYSPSIGPFMWMPVGAWILRRPGYMYLSGIVKSAEV